MEPQTGMPVIPGFSISHQKVELDIDPVACSLRGKTEIILLPDSKDLRVVRLNCRQCDIKRVTANSKVCSNISYEDPYKKAKLSWEANVHQHHMLQRKIEGQLKNSPEEELIITFPKSVRIDELNPLAFDAQTLVGRKSSVGPGSREDNPEIASVRTAVEQDRRFTPITLIIEYFIHHVKHGLQFNGWEDEDLRYPHAYTKDFAAPSGACSLFPCIDNKAARCTWEMAIKCPKTIGDCFSSSTQVLSNGLNGTAHPVSKSSNNTANNLISSNFSDEDKSLDLAVICTGDMTDEIDDPIYPTKKTSTFYCGNPISAQQVGFAIGPFEHVDLAEFREGVEDDKLGQNAVPLHGFCLPGRAEEVKNTCLPMAKGIDFFTLEYGSYPFSNYKLCFVDDCFPELIHTGFLTICSNNLLFSEDIIEPLERVSRRLIHALASQWMGVYVIPKDPVDTWVVVGIAYFMTEAFLRKLFGKNDYGYRQKTASDRIVDLDVGRPSLYDTGELINLDPFELEFLELKAPMVLSILDRRFTKTGSTSGLSRIISRVFLNAKVGDLTNGAIDTAYFIKTCERLGHLKLDTFFAQWVYGAGCPRFSIAQKFNKKKNVVDMLIKQTQAEPSERDLEKGTFMRDVKEEHSNVFAGPVQPVFTGPMTICIHEADGSPYEHLIEIKEAVTRVEILYNTKYKRLKRSRRQKERMATASGLEYNPDGNDDVLLYCLGDVLQSEEEIAQWRLADWTKEQEDAMNQESYEWIRVDSNFEWICKTSVGMPGYMYLSQLQQDKDVVAQLESVQYMAHQKEHPLISTILLRTLLDTRYFHGVRTAAIAALATQAKEVMNWLGLFHLEKAFQHFFCYGDSQVTRPNNFSDRAAYFVQCAIPRAIGKVRDVGGKSPLRARAFLLDKLKFNDNSDNDYSDCHYIATLMEALAEAMASKPLLAQDTSDDFSFSENDGDDLHFHNSCLEELDRYRRTDEWLPSYHNILSQTALDCQRILTKAGAAESNSGSFVQYTRDGTADVLRINAFNNLFELGHATNDSLLHWFLFAMGTDPSPYFREHAFRLFGKALGGVAIGDSTEEKAAAAAAQQDGLIIEQEATTDARAADLVRKRTVAGALAALKTEVGANNTLKEGLWAAISSPNLSLRKIKELLGICGLLYVPETSYKVVLKYPHYWRCTKVGKGKLRFTQSPNIRTKPRPKPVPKVVPQPTVVTTSPTILQTPTLAPPAQRKPLFKPPRRPSVPNIPSLPVNSPEVPAPSPAPPPDGAAKPKLKIKLKIGPRAAPVGGT